MTIPHTTLPDGIEIPQLGLGTWQVRPADTAGVVDDALQFGYRHIDTAQMYRIEAGAGEALRRSGLARDEELLWISDLNDDARTGPDPVDFG